MASNLLETLRREAGELLAKAKVYSVMNYAWIGENTPHDEYVGLAMWCTDAPFELTVNLWPRESVPPTPTSRDEIFLKSGEDFIGTMELAHNALGIVFYSFDNRNTRNIGIHDDEDPFWEYQAIAAQWLNMSSDRIRDYFIMARFGISAEQFTKRNYDLPFSVPCSHEGPEATSALQKLMPLSKELQQYRKTRNTIVHEVSSRRGHNAVACVKKQRREASQRSSIVSVRPNPPSKESGAVMDFWDERRTGSESRSAASESSRGRSTGGGV